MKQLTFDFVKDIDVDKLNKKDKKKVEDLHQELKKFVKKNSVSINFVLDKSGSMQSCRESTISGFNEYIGTLKEERTGDSLFTLTLFDTEFTKLYTNEPLAQIKHLNTDSYIPSGMTALYDATCSTINEVKKASDDKTPVLFIIMTDGEENSSKEYSAEQMKSLVKECEKKGWTFVYLGANQDAWAVAQKYGLSSINNVVTYNSTEKGTMQAFHAMATSTMDWANVADASLARGLKGEQLKNDQFFDNFAKARIQGTK